ncbi:TIGR04282 family arsenosugar biosynthesis glycosyltransferase [Parahaliea mediterranea]|uniref:TIGR04282 family arsenosugar biosynthesis glycosyltransferase n=1 Tax=Parahaliea mediterranea TaxID=651086 RepID=A0A939INC0_9GAMM|nr:TIGR04282 family arsenosugar biosynthesis glycosyltransferase [Parahaliea mediterranea]MBN7797958.1 TIGR04282 family arsenosugar biosynthesis glycosyltransferase [Parahaliea mediterranea]
MPVEAGDTLLLQFARAPRAGAVKTRMQPYLSADQACALHEELLRWTCRQLLAARLGPVELWVAGDGNHPALAHCLATGALGPRRQRGGDLGERMYQALVDGLARYRRVLLVGSDCPGLDAAYLEQAREALEHCDVVLGPAEDGGYVLIGARRVTPACFQGVAWGTEAVYAQSVARLDREGLTWRALAPRRDVDRPRDLPYWEACRREAATGDLRR